MNKYLNIIYRRKKMTEKNFENIISPGVYSKVVDQSYYIQENLSSGYFALQPFFSKRGPDNIIKTFDSLTKFEKVYGEGDFSKYGQAYLMAATYLKTKTPVQCCRLMPVDATFANLVLSYDMTPTDPSERDVIRGSYTNAASFEVMDGLLRTPSSTKNDFVVLFPIGRGKDYSKMSITIIRNHALDNTYTCPMYTIQVWDKDKNQNPYPIEGEGFDVSLDPDAVDVTGESVFIEHIISKYSESVCCLFDVDSYISIVMDRFELTDVDEVWDKDLLSTLPDLNDNTKNYFLNGSDGSLLDSSGRKLNWYGPSNATQDDIYMKCARSLLVEFFKGTIDSRILNRKNVPAKYIFDGNFPIQVKEEIHNFNINWRPDIAPIYDTNIQATAEQELDWRKNVFPIDTKWASIYANNYEVKDTYSGKSIRVSSTVKVAEKFGYVKNMYGINKVVAGYTDRGSITGIERLKYNPSPLELDNFYLAQINPIINDPKKGYAIFGNLTTQKRASALQNRNIVDTLQVIDVELSDFSEDYIFENLTESVLTDIKSKVEDYFVKWETNEALEKVTVQVYATAMDKKRKIVRVNVELNFTSIIEKILFTFLVKS
jgi:hypothetical protein